MLRPERRTRGDLLAAAAIVAVVAVVIAAFWWFSSARRTTFRPADGPAPNVPAAQEVPQSFTQLWSAASGKTAAPVVMGGTVVTGDGRTMAGIDTQTGAARWSYARDAELCAVSYVYDLAVAVYPDRRGCGQVSGIKADTGQRGPTRTSYADNQVVVSSDGTAVLSYGPTRLELWRSDLVRMLSYGEIDARIKPVNTGLGQGCALMSAAASDSAAAVQRRSRPPASSSCVRASASPQRVRLSSSASRSAVRSVSPPSVTTPRTVCAAVCSSARQACSWASSNRAAPRPTVSPSRATASAVPSEPWH